MCHDTLPTVKLQIVEFAHAQLAVQCLTRSKICGKNAASVSAFKSGGAWLATIKPSYKAIKAPATPGSVIARATISRGVVVGGLKSASGRSATCPASSGGCAFENTSASSSFALAVAAGAGVGTGAGAGGFTASIFLAS